MDAYRESRNPGIRRPGLVTWDESLHLSGLQSLSGMKELNWMISKVCAKSKLLGLLEG